MHLAAQRLKHTDEPVGSIARSLGYRSEYAFNRAFARERGRPPGRFRREYAQPGLEGSQEFGIAAQGG
jgi:AraC-like DNA-binding protein